MIDMMVYSNESLKFSKGRTATFYHFEQWPTYRNYIEGLPTQKSNQRYLESGLNEVKKRWGNISIYMLEPTQVQKSEGKNFRGEEHYELPYTTCVGFLLGDEGAMRESQLILVWLQDTFAFPIDEKILAQIERLDWNELVKG